MSARSAVAGMVILAVGFTAGAARATDGVIEINQAKAMAGGVTPGDVAGFPVTIDEHGSYRLTSDLDVSALGGGVAENTNVIFVTSSGTVTIDLNGFAILGPTFCPISCSPTGTGIGVVGGNSDQNLVLRNGTIRGMGGYGASVFAATVENVTFSHNGVRAIFQQGGVLRDSFAYRNGGGFETTNTEVSGCQSRDNLAFGIKALRIERSASLGNQGDGFQASGPVIDSLSSNNTGDALSCSTTCLISGDQFVGCSDADTCFGGAGTVVEAPAGSNLCGSGSCS